MSGNNDGGSDAQCGSEAFGGCCGDDIAHAFVEGLVKQYGSLENFEFMQQYITPHPEVTFIIAPPYKKGNSHGNNANQVERALEQEDENDEAVRSRSHNRNAPRRTNQRATKHNNKRR